MEARSLTGWSTSRHCVVAKALDITPAIFQSIKSKAGALIIVLPEKMNDLTMEEKQVGDKDNVITVFGYFNNISAYNYVLKLINDFQFSTL